MLCNGTVRKIRVRFFLGSSQHLLRLLCLIIEIKNLNCSYKTSPLFITVSVKNDAFLRITLFPEFHTDNVRMSAFLLFNMEGLLIRLNDVARPPWFSGRKSIAKHSFLTSVWSVLLVNNGLKLVVKQPNGRWKNK